MSALAAFRRVSAVPLPGVAALLAHVLRVPILPSLMSQGARRQEENRLPPAAPACCGHGEYKRRRATHAFSLPPEIAAGVTGRGR